MKNISTFFLRILIIAFFVIGTTKTSAQFAYFAAYGSAIQDTLKVVNTSTNTLVAKIPIGANSDAVVVSPDGSKVYVSYWNSLSPYTGGNVITVINTATNTIAANITFGTGIGSDGMDISPDGSKLYVPRMGNTADTIFVLNTSNYAIIAKIPLSGAYGVEGAVVSPDGTKLYVVDGNAGGIIVINTATNTIENIIPTAGSYGIAVTPDGTKLFATGINSDSVYVINTTNGSTIAKIDMGANSQPVGITVTPDGSKVYVAGLYSSLISVINTSTNTVLITLSCVTPYGIAVTPDGSKVYVASDPVSVINTATNTITGLTSLGYGGVSFGKFIGPALPSVPIALLDFTASQQSNEVLLNWQTSKESNSDYFNVQRSNEGVAYNNIGKVVATGNSNTRQTYKLNDTQLPSTPVVYYRLQIIDKDGSYTFSKTLAVALITKLSALSIFPNPVKEILFAQIASSKNEKVTLQITDMQGKVLQQQQVQLNVGSTSVSFNTAMLAKGIYVLKVNGDQVQSKQFVKE